MSNEKKVSYQTTNTYSTLNSMGPKTRNVWVVFHGMGYLSRYFLKYFRHLKQEENYFIAPQAPSKFYLKDEFKHVGASWLTRENTETEIENILDYLEEIYTAEQLQNAPNLIILGYSQGVSVATRWIARNKVDCSHLVLLSGKIPVELKSEDFQFLPNLSVTLAYGNADPYLSPEILKKEKEHAEQLFGQQLRILPFEGGHEVKKEVLSHLV